MRVTVYNQAGEEVGKMNLDEAVFGIEPRPDVVHRVVIAQLAAKRAASASTKNRSAVRGGGAKPYRQKGTGRARQGSIRAGHYRGGGVIFGPTPDRNYKKKIPVKVRRLAMRSCLSDKVRDARLRVLDAINFSGYSTKSAVKILDDLQFAGSKVMFVVNVKNGYFSKSVANLPGVEVAYAGSLTVYDVLYYDYLVLTKEAVKALTEVYRT